MIRITDRNLREKKMKTLSILLIFAFLTSSCSFSNSPGEAVVSKPADELEFTVDTIDTPPAEMQSEAQVAPQETIKVEEQKIVETKIPDEFSPIEENKEAPELAIVTPEEPKFEDYQKKLAPEVVEVKPAEIESASVAKEEQYHVQKGDTLMMVAFKIYGDYRKWKDLKAWNKDSLTTKMGPGVVLKYYVPEKNFGWQPSGVPYLIKTGDTLQIVSMDKYGTTKKWKNIYKNNQPLIRDPNLIFAGFTIYYLPDRDIASEKR